MTLLRAALLQLSAMRRRGLLLLGFVGAFLIAASSARMIAGDGTGQANLDRIFEVGGSTLASAYLLAGWAIGRFPLLAVLVLMAGVFADDRALGLARLHLTRPVSPLALYGVRVVVFATVAFLLSAALIPAFDLLLLGHMEPGAWAPTLGWIVAYGGLVAALSVWTRADAWVALLVAILATSWYLLRAGGMLDGVPIGGRQVVSLVLPPHGALLALESAFARGTSVPWNALLNTMLYGFVALLIGAAGLLRREI